VRLPESYLPVTEAYYGAGVFIFHPTIANYPQAKFPGVVVFSEIYQGA
jgi:carboxymethylenebutenolidase